MIAIIFVEVQRMGRWATDNRRIREKRGTGEYENYIPWAKIGDFRNTGTSSIVPDYKTGRSVHLFSRGELYVWHLLRWNDEIVDIREQYPMDLSETLKIAEKLEMMHPTQQDGSSKVMTIDFLVTYFDGHMEAISVKPDHKSLQKPRKIEIATIEKLYWQTKGVEYSIYVKEDLDMTYVHNIMDVVQMYNINDVYDDIGYLRHLIATKVIEVDMHKPLNYRQILTERGIGHGYINS